MTIAEQLTAIYKLESWHKNRLNDNEADQYHERLLVQGNIITYIIDGELKGYLEFWRLNHEQLGRLICNKPILTDVEDILNGNIAYINNMWIAPDFRGGEAFQMLSAMFLSRNADAEFFVAMRNMKNNKPIQVYSRKELIKFYNKGV